MSKNTKKLWSPNEEESKALQSYEGKINMMLDHVRMAHARRIYGVYIYGRPGISKTHTVRQYLEEEEGTDWKYVAGKITPRGLFESIAAHSNKTIVLDDVSAIFDDKTALQLLLSALAAPPEGQSARTVSYIKAGVTERVSFSGAVIAISNLTLKGHHSKLIDALKSRCSMYNHSPTNEEVAAFLLQLASQGVRGVKPKECMEVVRFLIDEVKKSGKEDLLSVRLFVDKALAVYSCWVDKIITHDWRDMVIASINEEAIALQHELQPIRETIRTVKADNKQALLDIIKSEPKAAVQLELAKQQLGISRATFFGHKAELVAAGLLSA